jgi:hypothetical protein
MKRLVKIMMMTMVLAIAVTSVMNAQRGMRGQMADSAWKGRQGEYFRQQREMTPDSGRMHHGMWQMPMYRHYPGFPQGPAMRRFELIPNLTEKQIKEIADLRQKQQAEMQKLREDNFARSKALRDAHHKKMMELFSDEQKKYLEGNK